MEITNTDGYYKVVIRDTKIDLHDGEIVARAVNEHGQVSRGGERGEGRPGEKKQEGRGSMQGVARRSSAVRGMARPGNAAPSGSLLELRTLPPSRVNSYSISFLASFFLLLPNLDLLQAESRARLAVEPVEEESRSAPTFLKDIEDQASLPSFHFFLPSSSARISKCSFPLRTDFLRGVNGGIPRSGVGRRCFGVERAAGGNKHSCRRVPCLRRFNR